jgi:hypothetical protein
MLMRKASFLGFVSLFLTGLALGGQAIPNWAAPATWSPARSHGVSAMDITNPLPFIGLPPCRIVDTRGNGAPITGGMFTGGSDVRDYAVSGICGIPSAASALSLNFTVTGPGQTMPGFLLAWPTGGAVPPVSILNWDHVPAQIANAAVVPTNGSTSFTVNVSAPTHVIIDVNGYYAETSSTTPFTFSTSGSLVGIEGDTFTTASFSSGVAGFSRSFSGRTYGVRGFSFSSSSDAAGVFGEDITGLAGGTGKLTAGVRGESSTHFGVLGQGNVEAISGELLNSSGGFLVAGVLGYTPDAGTTKWGVFAFGNIGASGTKPFIEAHPTDASKEIRYVALEGPEAGTYFRGRARFSHGMARIEVPESFRLVTDEEGLTVQITPIGQVAGYAVTRVGLDEIVVTGTRDVEFFYTVNGVRQTFKDWEVISASSDYMPRSADARMPEGFSPEQKRRLIANGTYNPDGTVNIETAERIGWTRTWQEWEERDRALAATAAANAARLAERK